MENFFKTKTILVKTRRLQSYVKLSKFTYIYLLAISLMNSGQNYKPLNIYFYHLNKELSWSVWKFFTKLVPANLGLLTSNHHKSAVLTTVGFAKPPTTINTASYATNLEVYHFYTKKDIFKKLIIFFMSTIGISYTPHNISFDIYNGYLWLGWYLKLNPMNNVFYLKVYNY